jgi:predicted membrane-bound spermidine synthase
VRGTALVAGLLNLAAATGALLAGARTSRATAEPAAKGERRGPRLIALLAAAALAGAIVLALETVWFRFLLLFVCGTTLAFAVMLAVVLAAIAAGALVASVWLARRPEAYRHAPGVAFAGGSAAVLTYAVFPVVVTRPCGLAILPLALALVFPVCALSGTLFTLLGTALRARVSSAIDAVAVITVANTLGGLFGALLGGFVLLPGLGVEASVFVAALAYGAAGLALVYALGPRAPSAGLPARGRRVAWGSGLVLAVALALFPFGRMRAAYLPPVLARFLGDGSHVVATREGLTETSAWVSLTLWGEPVAHRLVTNGFSMAATGYNFDRYTRLFAYWAAAVRPQMRRVLLISYGVGSTAGALVSTPGLETLDVVDISRDVLELGRAAVPGPHPLADPRVRLHIEDGRQFLLLNRARYDVITAEPPPPHNAGIVNLYSREYFDLVRERLVDGGVVTYWLPNGNLTPREAWSITAGFCGAFPDCSLWTGYGLEWMLAGTRGLGSGPDEGAFSAQWRSPARAADMAVVGFESPDRLGATFLADAGQLAALIAGAPPVVDDFPYRIPPRETGDPDSAFARVMDVETTRRRFQESAWIARTWPASVREATLARFGEQGVVNRLSLAGPTSFSFAEAVRTLAAFPRRYTSLWLLGCNEDIVRAARIAEAHGVSAPLVDHALGASALADGADGEAAARFTNILDHTAGPTSVVLWRAYALCRAGDGEGAARALREGAGRLPSGERDPISAFPVRCRPGA